MRIFRRKFLGRLKDFIAHPFASAPIAPIAPPKGPLSDIITAGIFAPYADMVLRDSHVMLGDYYAKSE